jgi:hypothetical protein
MSKGQNEINKDVLLNTADQGDTKKATGKDTKGQSEINKDVFVVADGVTFATPRKGVLEPGDLVIPEFFCSRKKDEKELEASTEAFEEHKNKGFIITENEYKKLRKKRA